MSTQHQPGELLGAYALGILDPEERREIEEHTAMCDSCRRELEELREMETSLGEVPPEAFLEGPVEDGDLLLQRTLRQARAEEAASRRRRSFALGAAAAASAVVVFLGGYLVAGTGPSDAQAGGPPPATASPLPSPAPTGIRMASATDSATRAGMTVRLTPAAGWVRVNAAVTGIPAGERCRLVVVSDDGERQTAGSWVVAPGAKGKGKGADLDGSAAVAPDHVKSVLVENTDGKRYVTVSL
ncbi:hypothetical protein GCM10018793_63560 [Streptomyces sulfonofaciens]|uniref:Putative zinc-finger domain-containing protein n=1 Tax=Streptomyces sulfonofaciens TaxID=68272 RepID=A0A919L868_9ACTN|nr:zf-HC2 domain-containing protein [Streptomyces sulfonofaciens]GHH87508.1 hypothetical protein GCM10018793_63560 [Streptomyces sulfonofaciens]